MLRAAADAATLPAAAAAAALWHAGDHARVSEIVSEVERRDLRAATARLQQQQEQQSEQEEQEHAEQDQQ
jgi:hypothetical protein